MTSVWPTASGTVQKRRARVRLTSTTGSPAALSCSSSDLPAISGRPKVRTNDGLIMRYSACGRSAGAGVPTHLHIHVLPRWNGDTNFMTSVAEVRVLPEALSASAAKVRAAWPGSVDGDG